MNELRELVRVANAALRDAGVRVREREVNGHVEYSMLIPSRPRKVIVTARVALPADEIGKLFGKGGQFRATAKKVAKKLAKSKVLSKVAKLAPMLAAVVPGGQVIAAGAAAAMAARRIAKAAKSGNPKAKAFAKAAAKAHTVRVQRARSVQKAPPGYPNAFAAEQPGPVAPSPFGGADGDDGSDVELDDGGESTTIEVDASEEDGDGGEGDFGGPDAGWPSSDVPSADYAE